ncbi:hypothetical protein BDY21DRAFT_345576 [Lineolata rhizophorae]|uniref:Uncharacterized protein n=1 Tax=Lineolata rhizophorae TaxID=578093 RepID=A0A6A6P0N5_9PEZI|nr:hypothetical protein BDY21DRAFT_345576 [Lineolata rhizophorae]
MQLSIVLGFQVIPQGARAAFTVNSSRSCALIFLVFSFLPFFVLPLNWASPDSFHLALPSAHSSLWAASTTSSKTCAMCDEHTVSRWNSDERSPRRCLRHCVHKHARASYI